MKFRTALCLAIAAVVMVGQIDSSTSAYAQAAKDAFTHRELTLLIPSGPGGGYDRYARLLGRYIGKHLPGNPTVVAKAMPGSGGTILANFMYAKAPRDGSTIAGMQNERILDPILGVQNATYKSSELTWLGSMNQTTNVCIAWHTTGIRSAEELRSKELLTGVVPNTSTQRVALLLNELAGTKLRMVFGYPGTTEVILAMERGEVSGVCGLGWDSLKSGRRDLLAEKKLNIFVQMGTEPLDELKGVPFLGDIVQKPEDKAVLDFVVGRMYLGRPFVGPPGLSPAMTQILRDAFWSASNDPELLAEAAKAELPISPVSGRDAQSHVEKLEKTPPPVIARARKLL
jgi:tripartite-type tricarboxylate transporter receptor subunit TctC